MSKIKQFDLSNVKLGQLAIHKVGNKTQEEPIELSNQETEIENYSPLYKMVMNYFLKVFKSGAMFHFDAPKTQESFKDNEVYKCVERIFEDRYNNLFADSKELAHLLYHASTHPRIKGGEFFVAYLGDCVVDGDIVDAVGLFKAEHVNSFLEVSEGDIDYHEGINVNKLDKGCLIFNTERERGYKVMLNNIPTRSVEALYWKEAFLQLRAREDNFFHTQNYMDLCVAFVEEVFNEEHAVEKPAQIDLLNRSLKYFKGTEDFHVVDFENNVIEEPEVIEAFQSFTSDFSSKKGIPIFDEFKISKEAVRKSQKLFKSIIKLDKKISIVVGGNEQSIEKGFDSDKNMNYYIVYFNEES